MIKVLLSLVILMGGAACSKSAKSALSDAMNGVQVPADNKGVDWNKYERASANQSLLDLPSGTLLRFTSDLIIPQGAEYDGFNVGVYLQNGTPISNDKVAQIDVFGEGSYCILTVDGSYRPNILSGDAIEVGTSHLKTQYTTNGSFEGVEITFTNVMYSSVVVRGRSLDDLNTRCLGSRAETWIPKNN